MFPAAVWTNFIYFTERLIVLSVLLALISRFPEAFRGRALKASGVNSRDLHTRQAEAGLAVVDH